MKIRAKRLEEVTASLLAAERAARRACEDDRERLASRLSQLERENLPAFIETLSASWRSDAVPTPRQGRSVDDPVYGQIFIDDKLATLLAHPILQRLNHVKQLSFSYLQYPSATHSRLAHSLGAAKNAEVALGGILDRGVYFEVGKSAHLPLDEAVLKLRQQLIEKAKVAALLHDLGHGPFGHALDDYVSYENVSTGQLMPDKRYTPIYVCSFLGPTLRFLGFDPNELVTILGHKRKSLPGIQNLIADIVDSSLDVDRMDYLTRDAQMTGLTMGFTNTAALIAAMRPVLDGGSLILAYEESVMPYMEHFLLARDAMFLNCYEHPRKKAAERMFTRLIEHLKEDTSLGLSIDNIFALTDEEIMTALRALASGSDFRRRLVEELMTDVDYEVIYEAAVIRDPERPMPNVLHDWVRAATKDAPATRKMAYITQPAAWEEAIAAESIGTDRSWQVQVVVPAHEVYAPEYNATQLLINRGGVFETVGFFDHSSVVRNLLKEMNSLRERIRVLCPAHLPIAERSRIRAAAALVLNS